MIGGLPPALVLSCSSTVVVAVVVGRCSCCRPVDDYGDDYGSRFPSVTPFSVSSHPSSCVTGAASDAYRPRIFGDCQALGVLKLTLPGLWLERRLRNSLGAVLGLNQSHKM